MQVQESFSVVIPAAGTSERMGTAKAWLKLADGTAFVENILNVYSRVGAHPVVLVVNQYFDAGNANLGGVVRVVNDRLDLGRIHSIRMGLKHIPESRRCFIHNIDNPFIQPQLLMQLLNSAVDGSYVMPVYEGRGGHPVLLSKEVIAELVNNDHLHDFREALKKFKRVEVPCDDPEILLNLNTPGDHRNFIGHP
jgi:molybdenum cofactor cytidylyltransferase